MSKKNTSNYKAVDGRVYQTEPGSGPLPIRESEIRNLVESERISATDLWKIEAFLRGEPVDEHAVPDQQVRKDIAQKYGLVKENDVQKTARWIGDPVAVFEKICEQWPDAVRFKKYKGVLYAMRYGDVPCKVYKNVK